VEGAALSRGRRSLRRLIANLAWRGYDAYDRAVYPGTNAPADHWVRTILNRAVDGHINTLGPTTLNAAEISGQNHASRPWLSYTSLTYPEFDVCAPLELEQRFDVVICEQVLEHVPDPWAAARNLRELSRPGGHVIVSTPFLIKVHELLLFGMHDYWRFTPRGLRVLLEAGGLEVDSIGSWGNRVCVTGNLSRWAAYRPWHPLRNEPDVPVQVWAFAHRPEVDQRGDW
jgi:SAM-dependent methyltransferase